MKGVRGKLSKPCLAGQYQNNIRKGTSPYATEQNDPNDSGCPDFGSAVSRIRLPDGTEKLFSWRYSDTAPQDSTPASFTEVSVPKITQEDTAALAKEFEDEFGITIVTRDQVPETYYNYHITQLDDEESIFSALLLLQAACRNYPKGMFRQVDLSTGKMKILLADDITDTSDTSVKSPPGIAVGTNLVLAASARLGRATVYHEINHILVSHMESRGGEEDLTVNFGALNPEGFVYGSNYKEENSVQYTPLDPEDTDYANTYFASDYGKTNENEDMSEMMGGLMGSVLPDDYCKGAHIQAKYRYLFGLFRKYFDTDGWDRQLTWEKRLDYLTGTA